MCRARDSEVSEVPRVKVQGVRGGAKGKEETRGRMGCPTLLFSGLHKEAGKGRDLTSQSPTAGSAWIGESGKNFLVTGREGGTLWEP